MLFWRIQPKPKAPPLQSGAFARPARIEVTAVRLTIRLLGTDHAHARVHGRMGVRR